MDARDRGHVLVREAFEAQQVLVASVLSGFLYVVVAWCEPALMSRAHRRLALFAYVIAVAGLYACYVTVLRAVQRRPTGFASILAVGAPVLFQLGWVIVPPRLSIDVFSYLADGALWQLGLNPYTHAAREIGATPFGTRLAFYGWRPVHGISPYGPIWMAIEAAVGRVNMSVPAAVLALKGLVLLASTLIAAFIYATVNASGHDDALAAAMLYWWNPLVITEFAGEGHNDALMILAVVVGLYCIGRRQAARGLGAIAVAVLVKYLPAIFAGPVFVYLWRTEGRGRFVRAIVIALPVGAAIATLAFWPFWAGRATFLGLSIASQRTFGPGTSGALFWILDTASGNAAAAAGTALVIATVFLALVVVQSLRVRDRDTMFAACATLALGYALIAAPRYWPWYVTMPAALLSLRPTPRNRTLVYVITVCAMLVAPLDTLRVYQALSWTNEIAATTLIGVWVPLLVWVSRSSGSRPAVPNGLSTAPRPMSSSE